MGKSLFVWPPAPGVGSSVTEGYIQMWWSAHLLGLLCSPLASTVAQDISAQKEPLFQLPSLHHFHLSLALSGLRATPFTASPLGLLCASP